MHPSPEEPALESAASDPAPMVAEEPAPSAAAAAQAAFQILGATLGMELQKAIETIKAELDAPVIFQADRQARASWDRRGPWEPFNVGVLLRSGDGTEAVALYHEPPAAGAQFTPGMAERGAHHDRQRHRADGAGSEGMGRGGRQHEIGPEDRQCCKEEAERHKGVADMQHEQQRVPDGAITRPAC